MTNKKHVRTEHYEVKKINPLAEWPGDRVVVHGSYKVQETDPNDHITTAVHSYDSPTSKILAEILANFGGRYDNYHPFDQKSKEKEEEDEDHLGYIHEEKNDIEDDHDEYNFPYGHYEDKDEDKKKNKDFIYHPYENVKEGHDDDDDEHSYNYGTEDYEKYIYRKVYGNDFDN